MIAGGWRRQQGAPPARIRTPPARSVDLAHDRARALALTPVSRETAARLDRFAGLLLDWQRCIKLVAASTETRLWTRHIADSLQLNALAPSARIWADLGSGGGFPGLVIACALADTPAARVYLVESNVRKAAFLSEAVRATGAPAVVYHKSIADFVRHAPEPIDIVTARALAPLPELLAITYPLLRKGAVGLFPKGRSVGLELTKAAKCWRIQASLVLSRTDPKARIVTVRGVEPVLDPKARMDSRRNQ